MTISALELEIIRLRGEQKNWDNDAIKYSNIIEQHKAQSELIAKVKAIHTDIIEWDLIAKALSPDGIPAELLNDALLPINARLETSSQISEWQQVSIAPDMQIFYGKRDRSLCSESEQYRCDAMLAEAIGFISGLKMLLLDRFDVLDPQKGRGDLLYWLDDLAVNGELEAALLFGTLKAVPQNLPDTVTGIWIENGTNFIDLGEVAWG